MPDLEEVSVPEAKQALWEELGGTELDPVLDNFSVVLIGWWSGQGLAAPFGRARPRRWAVFCRSAG